MSCEKVPCGMMYKCPGYYCLPWNLVCDGFWDCPRGSDEEFCVTRNCSGMFSCPNTSICIHMAGICNSVIDCPGLNDEVFCDLPPCQSHCHCLAYMIHCTNATKPTIFGPYSFISFVHCNLGNNFLNNLHSKQIRNVHYLDLTGNHITDPCQKMSKIQANLELLNLACNKMHYVKSNCLGKLIVKHIGLERNEIQQLEGFAFSQQKGTISMNLDQNRLLYLNISSFNGMEKLKILSLLRNGIMWIDKQFFVLTTGLRINLDSALICCMYKTHNIWCDLEENANPECIPDDSFYWFPLELVVGCVELVTSIIMCLLYFREYLSKLIKPEARSYRTSLVGMYLNQAFYAIGLILVASTEAMNQRREHHVLLIQLQNESTVCPIVSVISFTSILCGVFLQIFISFLRYEAIKWPFFTKFKKSTYVRNIIIIVFILSLFLSSTLVLALQVVKNSIHQFTLSCSLLSIKGQYSYNIFTLSAWFIILVYVSSLLVVNTFYTLLYKGMDNASLTKTTNNKKKSLILKIVCLLFINNLFWLASSILLLPFQFTSVSSMSVAVSFYLDPVH